MENNLIEKLAALLFALMLLLPAFAMAEVLDLSLFEGGEPRQRYGKTPCSNRARGMSAKTAATGDTSTTAR